MILAVGIAAPAAANGHGANGIAAAGHQGAAARGARLFVAERTPPVPVNNARSGAHLILRAPIAGLWREVVDRDPGLTLPTPLRRERSGSPVLPWAGPERPALGLPVSKQLSVAVGYQHVEGEDRWRPYGEAGPVDYDSHDFLLGVAWRF
jgi:hypothetical protein